MTKNILLFIIFFLPAMALKSEMQEIKLTFTSEYNETHVKTDSVLIKNITQDWSKKLYYPDSVMILAPTNISDYDKHNNFYVSQNYPNPFSKKTNIDIYVSNEELFSLNVYDLSGRKVANYQSLLEQGLNHFTFYACNRQNYILDVTSESYKQVRLMIHAGESRRTTAQIKHTGVSHKKESQQNVYEDYPYYTGDEFKFIGYSTGESDNLLSDTILDVPENEEIYVFNMQRATFTLTLTNEPEEGGYTEGSGNYMKNEEVDITAIAGEGYKFENWTGDIDYIDDANSETTNVKMPDEDISLTANFALKDYEFTVEIYPDDAGYVNINPERDYYNMGDEINLEAIANEGYIFQNWSKDGTTINSEDEFVYDMPAENVTLTAKFVDEEAFLYTLSLEANPSEGGTVAGGGNFEEDQTVNISADANNGWEFVNWSGDTDYVDDTGSEATTVTMPAYDIDLTANFELVDYELIVDVYPENSGNVNFDPEQDYYNMDDEITIEAIPEEDYEFENWTGDIDYIDDANSETTNVTMPAENIELTANFQEKEEEFACGDILIDPRDDKEYATVKIGDQCWMAESLNVGTMIDGSQNQDDENKIEKYCYDDDEANCDVHGGLYQWDQAMDYSTEENTQGICPPGWFLPSDDVVKTLEMELGMTQNQANGYGWRGSGIGTSMKVGGDSGLEIKLSGTRYWNGGFGLINSFGYFYTSTESDDCLSGDCAWRRCLKDDRTDVGRYDSFPKTAAYSVRCVKKED